MKILIAAVIVASNFCCTVHAEGCPDTLELSISATSASSQWNFSNKLENLALRSIGISDGEPGRKYILRPSKTQHSGDRRTVTWDLLGASHGGYWIYCGYGDSHYEISHQLEGKFQQCVVNYSQTKVRVLKFRDIACR